MQTLPKWFGLILLLAVLGGLVLWAITDSQQTQTSGEDTDTLQVATTLPPYATFIERIGGERVDVQTMVPADQSPHAYEPTSQQLQRVAGTDVYFSTGTQIIFEEQWLADILENAGDPQVVDTAEGVALLEKDHDHSHEASKDENHNHDHSGEGEEHKNREHDTEAKDKHHDSHSEGSHDQHDHSEKHADSHAEHHEENAEKHAENKDTSFDPHVWTSPRRALKIAETIKEGLVEADPEYQSTYEENYTELQEDLEELDRRAQDINRSLFVVDHPAWGYFAEDYGVEQVAIEEEGKQPSPQRLQTVISRAREEEVSHVIHDPQVNRRAAEAVANELSNAEIVTLRPNGKDYMKTLSQFLNALEESS